MDKCTDAERQLTLRYSELNQEDLQSCREHSLFVSASIGAENIEELARSCRWIGVREIGFADGYDDSFSQVYVLPRDVIPQLSNVADQVLRIDGRAAISSAAQLVVKETHVYDFALHSEIGVSCVEVNLLLSPQTAQKIIEECRAQIAPGLFPRVDFVLRLPIAAFPFPPVRGSMDTPLADIGPFAVVVNSPIDLFDFVVVSSKSRIAKVDSVLRDYSFVSGIRIAV